MRKERAYELRDIISHAMQNTDDLTAAGNPTLFPEWESDMDYAAGTKVRYNGKLYKVTQSHISEQFHTPEDAPDLFSELPGADEMIVGE